MTTPTDTPKYERLIRGVRRYDNPFVAPVYRLWLGPDHILQIRSAGYSETYKRFYFRDIQAIVAAKTIGYTLRFVIYGAFLALSILLAYLSEFSWGWEGVGVALFGIMALVCFTLLLLNALRGPTCACTIYTGVQVEPLAALCRMRKARTVISRLQPVIEEAQGTLTPDQIREKLAATEPSIFTRKLSVVSKTVAEGPLRHNNGNLHAVFLAMTLVAAGLSFLDLYVISSAKDLFDATWFLSRLVLGVVILSRHEGTDIKKSMSKVVWAILAAMLIEFIVAMASMGFFTATNAGMNFDPNSVEWKRHFHDWPFFHSLTIITGLVDALLGVVGFLVLWDFRRLQKEPQVEEVSPAADAQQSEES